jgi:hypothetical protein
LNKAAVLRPPVAKKLYCGSEVKQLELGFMHAKLVQLKNLK